MLKKIIFLFFLISITIFVYAYVFATGSENRTEPVQRVLQAELDIDMFIGSWKESEPRLIYGTLEVLDILTKCEGNPLHPSKKGAVLTSVNSVSYAILRPYKSTVPVTLKNKQQIFYIDSGEGIIKSDGKTADLNEGIGVLIAPGIKFSITNTGDEKLTMYIIEEPITEDLLPKKKLVIKDTYDNPISTNLKRVNNASDWLFSRYDGLSVIAGINTIIWEPRSYYPPHVHSEGEEEIWVMIVGDLDVQIGNQRRNLSAGSAYKVPANGKTPHININKTSQFRKVLWIMCVPSRTPGKSPGRYT